MSGPPIRGRVAAGLEPVRETFAANFTRGGDYQELGAALCVYRGDEPIVDLWGGFSDAAQTRAWTAEMLVNVWSTTKPRPRSAWPGAWTRD